MPFIAYYAVWVLLFVEGRPMSYSRLVICLLICISMSLLYIFYFNVLRDKNWSIGKCTLTADRQIRKCTHVKTRRIVRRSDRRTKCFQYSSSSRQTSMQIFIRIRRKKMLCNLSIDKDIVQYHSLIPAAVLPMKYYITTSFSVDWGNNYM